MWSVNPQCGREINMQGHIRYFEWNFIKNRWKYRCTVKIYESVNFLLKFSLHRWFSFFCPLVSALRNQPCAKIQRTSEAHQTPHCNPSRSTYNVPTRLPAHAWQSRDIQCCYLCYLNRQSDQRAPLCKREGMHIRHSEAQTQRSRLASLLFWGLIPKHFVIKVHYVLFICFWYLVNTYTTYVCTTRTFWCSYHEPSELRSTNTKIEVGIFGFLGLNFQTLVMYFIYYSFVFDIWLIYTLPMYAKKNTCKTDGGN